jgi:hypothetical protein
LAKNVGHAGSADLAVERDPPRSRDKSNSLAAVAGMGQPANCAAQTGRTHDRTQSVAPKPFPLQRRGRIGFSVVSASYIKTQHLMRFYCQKESL